jgi:hypothetical protein
MSGNKPCVLVLDGPLYQATSSREGGFLNVTSLGFLGFMG